MDEVKPCECACGGPAPIGRRFILGHNMIGPDLVGRVFGKITVFGKAPRVTNRQKWECVCECGERFTRRGSVLLTGKSTGCRSCNNGNKGRPYEALYNFLVSQAEGRTTVSLTYEQFLEFTKIDACTYCGVEIVWRPYYANSNGHHLDRKDNAVGYTKDNCVVCCPRCNRGKSDHFTYEEWVQIGNLIRSWK